MIDMFIVFIVVMLSQASMCGNSSTHTLYFLLIDIKIIGIIDIFVSAVQHNDSIFVFIMKQLP